MPPEEADAVIEARRESVRYDVRYFFPASGNSRYLGDADSLGAAMALAEGDNARLKAAAARAVAEQSEKRTQQQ
jgi:hypothetical protein